MSDDNDNIGLEEESFDNFEKKKSTLGDMWREKPLFKVGVVVGAAALIFGTVIFMGGSDKGSPQVSMVPPGSDLSAPPGTDETSPAYVEAVKEQNTARMEEAERDGTSSLPTPIEPPKGSVSIAEEENPEEDPLQRWQALQEERLARELQRAQQTVPVDQSEVAANRQQEVDALSALMSTQMQAILESRNQVKVSQRSITDPNYLNELKAEEQREAEIAAGIAANDPAYLEEILYPAGQIAYAQLITEANSDAPGPVLAQIAGGPLNGARLLGDFQVQNADTDNNNLLTLNFDTIVIDGISYTASAVALDPATTLPAMATDVDHHYFKRVVLPMAASFVEGLATAVSDSGTTTVTVDGGAAVSDETAKTEDQEVASGVAEAGREMSEILGEMADDTKVTVRIESGTPIGVLFLEPVTKRGNEPIYNQDGSMVTGSASNL
jgi:intracellular multiplication protein IcmE